MDWLLSFTTMISQSMLAYKLRAGWIVSACNQLIWAWIIWHEKLWGLVPLGLFMLGISVKGWINWKR